MIFNSAFISYNQLNDTQADPINYSQRSKQKKRNKITNYMTFNETNNRVGNQLNRDYYQLVDSQVDSVHSQRSKYKKRSLFSSLKEPLVSEIAHQHIGTFVDDLQVSMGVTRDKALPIAQLISQYRGCWWLPFKLFQRVTSHEKQNQIELTQREREYFELNSEVALNISRNVKTELFALAKAFPDIKKISILDSKISTQNLKLLLSIFPSLNHLDLRGSKGFEIKVFIFGVKRITMDKAFYWGQFKKDKFHGYGIKSEADGKRYAGWWKNNKFDGLGTYTNVDGSSYQGYWKNDKKEGKGIYKYANGDCYDGNWKDDIFISGRINHTFDNDGSKFEGQVNDQFEKIGIFTEPNGEKYEVWAKLGRLGKRGTIKVTVPTYDLQLAKFLQWPLKKN